MKKILLTLAVFIIFTVFISVLDTQKSFAASHTKQTVPVLLAQVIVPTPPPADGTWLPDSEVTFSGKNASRSKDLFNWTLQYYQWAYQDNPLVDFWVKIRNIVFAFLILLVLIAAFSMIVTGGQSLRSLVFVRKFIFVVLLIAFSFAMIRFLYQINDVIIGFFVRNPDGNVISSKDLLNISFDYGTFVGYRKYGMQYDESAFVSLLLVKITAFTYFVMAAILMIRKVILWFFITVSPIYPLLLFYYPIRNTAKIWIGEFFRWLLYAPLFTIFLNALVQLWRANISILPFNFAHKAIVYPTAVNILLGGPGQTLAIDNNINYNDTFAQYVVALIMVWVVILLPFLLLKIFLDYLSSININKDAAIGYINNARNYITNRDMFNNKPPGPGPSRPPSQPAGIARNIPFISTGAAKEIPQGNAISQNASTASKTINQYANTTYNTSVRSGNRNFSSIPKLKTEQLSAQTLQLVNFPIPTMRDVARFETEKLTSRESSREQVTQMQSTLQKIANPYTITNTSERQQFAQVREKLFQQKVKGDTLASSILNAANNVTNISSKSSSASSSQTSQINNQKVLNETLQKLANPGVITNSVERQQITQIKETLQKDSQSGNPVASSVLSVVNNLEKISNNQQVNQNQFSKSIQTVSNPSIITNTNERQQYNTIKETLQTQIKQGNQAANTLLTNTQNQQVLTTILQKLANPETISNTTERQQFNQIKETLIKEQKNGNNVATSLLNTINNTSNTTKESVSASSTMQRTLENLANPESIPNTAEREQYTKLKNELKQQSQNGNPLASSLLKAAEIRTQIAETTATSALLPSTNQVQTVNLEDYEEVKNMWSDNYKNVEVPKSIEQPDRTRSEWIKSDINQIQDTVRLLTSTDQSQVSKGMEQVSSLLPFLLIGGFSQTEVIAYLKAKQKAAEDVLEQLKNSKEEEETSEQNVHRKKQSVVQHQSVSLGNEAETNEDVESPLQNITTITRTINLRPELLNSKTLSLVNFPIPTMHDVARYEAAKITEKYPDNQNIASQLEQAKRDSAQAYDLLYKIANPSEVADTVEREKFEQMKQIIIKEQQEGNPLASSILSAANNIAVKSPQKQNISEMFKKLLVPVLQNIDKPENISDISENNYYSKLKENLVEESKSGNPLSIAVLNAAKYISEIESSTYETDSEKTLRETLMKISDPDSARPEEKQTYVLLKDNLSKDSQQNDRFAINILGLANIVSGGTKLKPAEQVTLPLQNQVQTVNLDDYEDVKKMWVDNYKNIDVPLSLEKPERTRVEWIHEDMQDIDNAVALLTSDDKEKVSEGMSIVSGILPFLLIGGFSITEIIAYLKAKKNAGQEVIDDLENTNTEETFVDGKEKKMDQSLMAEQSDESSETPLSQNGSNDQEQNNSTMSTENIQGSNNKPSQQEVNTSNN